MFCSQCGANNADTATFCGQCGKSLQAAPSVAVPTGAIGQTPAAYVPNYLVFAILTTVLCCLPAGIAAIVYAAQVNGKLQAGDILGAQAASKNAKLWCWIAAGAGIGVCVIWVIVAVLGGVLSHMNR
ncbi:MAG: CD225/dispanin family protein [Candidatus Sulfotelmatobacter sp.]